VIEERVVPREVSYPMELEESLGAVVTLEPLSRLAARLDALYLPVPAAVTSVAVSPVTSDLRHEIPEMNDTAWRQVRKRLVERTQTKWPIRSEYNRVRYRVTSRSPY
jgi:hypothetical protein